MEAQEKKSCELGRTTALPHGSEMCQAGACHICIDGKWENRGVAGV